MMKTILLAVVICFIGLTTTTSVSASTNTTSVPTNATSVPTKATSLSTSTNTTSVPTNATSVSSNATSVSTNTTSVPTNATSVSTNATSVSTNATSVPTNATSVLTNTTSVPTNATSVSTNATCVPTNATSVSTNTTSVPTNATSVSTNATSIPTNATSVPTNATSLSTSTSTTSVSTNATSVSTNATSVPTNATSVSTNATSVPTNATSVSTNATSVSTNATSVPTNATSVPTNATSVSTNATSVPTNATSLSTSTNTTSVPTNATSLSTSTNTSLSTSTNTPLSTSTSASKTILTPPPPSMSPHPEKAYFNLGFSLKINATFTNDLKNVTSSEYANYSKAFKDMLSQAYGTIPGFSHIVIKGFRNGSIICDYTAVITATANPNEVLPRINDTVTVDGKHVDSKYLRDTWNKDLEAAKDEMKYICNAENICDIGYKCKGTGNRIKCTSNCEVEDCGDHGVCQLKADGQPICRCQMHPKYVYSGDKCEIKGEQLLLKSEYIAAIAGGGGGGLVLILGIALICTCARKRKAKEKRDGPLSAYDESPGQHWTSHVGDPHRHNNPAYEAVEMNVIPPQRAQHGSGEEPFYVYQPSNITKPMTRASAEYASFMDEGRTGAAHDLHIKNRADTGYTNRYVHDERHNTGEGASRDAGHVPASLEADIIDDVRRHDRMRQSHDRTGQESFDANRVSVAGLYPEITKHPRDSISITPNTPQMQIENSKLDRREQDGYPSRDHRGQDDEQSRGRYHHGQDGYPSRDHPRRVDSPSLDRREQEGYQSRDQRGQDSYIPRDRNLERLHREERMSDGQRQSPGSFRDDRRSPREADYGHQPAHPSPVLRQKGLGEARHPHSFITIPEPDYGVDHGSVTEHDRHRPSQRRDNDAGEGRQLYRNESHGNVNDSQFARDLQRRRTEIKSQGEGVMDRMIDTRDRRGQWQNSDRRNENRSRQRRGDYQMNHHL